MQLTTSTLLSLLCLTSSCLGKSQNALSDPAFSDSALRVNSKVDLSRVSSKDSLSGFPIELGFSIERKTPSFDKLYSKNGEKIVSRSFEKRQFPLGAIEMGLTESQTVYKAQVLFGSSKEPISLMLDTRSCSTWVNSKNVRCYEPSSTITNRFHRRFDETEKDLNISGSEEHRSKNHPDRLLENRRDELREIDSMNCQQAGAFDPDFSSSFRTFEQLAPYNVRFQDGAFASGFWGQDTLQIGDVELRNVPFAIAEETDNTMGILGLGPECHRSSKGENVYPETLSSFPELLKKRGLIERAVYSLFLDRRSSEHGGVALFGAVDHAKYAGSLHTVPLTSLYSQQNDHKTHFAIFLDSIYVKAPARPRLTVSVGRLAILDSGSTFCVFPSSILSPLAEKLKAEWSEEMQLFEVARGSSKLSFVVFQIAGTEIKIPTSRFLVKIQSRLFLGASLAEHEHVVLGEEFLRHAYVVIDAERQEASIAQAVYTSKRDIERVVDEIPKAVRIPKVLGDMKVGNADFERNDKVLFSEPSPRHVQFKTEPEYIQNGRNVLPRGETRISSEPKETPATSSEVEVQASSQATGVEEMVLENSPLTDLPVLETLNSVKLDPGNPEDEVELGGENSNEEAERVFYPDSDESLGSENSENENSEGHIVENQPNRLKESYDSLTPHNNQDYDDLAIEEIDDAMRFLDTLSVADDPESIQDEAYEEIQGEEIQGAEAQEKDTQGEGTQGEGIKVESIREPQVEQIVEESPGGRTERKVKNIGISDYHIFSGEVSDDEITDGQMSDGDISDGYASDGFLFDGGLQNEEPQQDEPQQDEPQEGEPQNNLRELEINPDVVSDSPLFSGERYLATDPEADWEEWDGWDELQELWDDDISELAEKLSRTTRSTPSFLPEISENIAIEEKEADSIHLVELGSDPKMSINETGNSESVSEDENSEVSKMAESPSVEADSSLPVKEKSIEDESKGFDSMPTRVSTSKTEQTTASLLQSKTDTRMDLITNSFLSTTRPLVSPMTLPTNNLTFAHFASASSLNVSFPYQKDSSTGLSSLGFKVSKGGTETLESMATKTGSSVESHQTYEIGQGSKECDKCEPFSRFCSSNASISCNISLNVTMSTSSERANFSNLDKGEKCPDGVQCDMMFRDNPESVAIIPNELSLKISGSKTDLNDHSDKTSIGYILPEQTQKYCHNSANTEESNFTIEVLNTPVHSSSCAAFAENPGRKTSAQPHEISLSTSEHSSEDSLSPAKDENSVICKVGSATQTGSSVRTDISFSESPTHFMNAVNLSTFSDYATAKPDGFSVSQDLTIDTQSTVESAVLSTKLKEDNIKAKALVFKGCASKRSGLKFMRIVSFVLSVALY